MQKITDAQIKELALKHGMEPAVLKTFIEVEASGQGFDPVTGKILIQFEPHWFKKKYKDWQKADSNSVWLNNKVSVQSKEWEAFNDAFDEDKSTDADANAAMESTSIGMGQIMGFHWKRIGYSSVGAMWDDFKKGEYQQVEGIIKFIQTDPNLAKAIKTKNWHLVATYYNGSGYKELAKKLKTVPYDQKLAKTYLKYSKIM